MDDEDRARVNRDDLRAMMYGAQRLTFAQEMAVTEASRELVRALLKTGRDVVADDMNLRPRYVREWARFAAANGAEVEITEFPISVEDSIARDAERERTVGAETIERMAGKYLRKGQLLPIPDLTLDADPADVYEPKPGTPPAVMVDIDGTLALHNGRSPYDLARCGDDLPNQAVIDAVWAARQADMDVLYCSGREDSARDATDAWLYDVRYVLDDRDQVVEMWRGLGLTVFQVAKGDF